MFFSFSKNSLCSLTLFPHISEFNSQKVNGIKLHSCKSKNFLQYFAGFIDQKTFFFSLWNNPDIMFSLIVILIKPACSF